MTYRQYFEEIKKGTIVPVYLLFGEEDFLMEEAVKALATRILGSADGDFNRNYLDGEEVGFEEVRAAVETLPFGAAQRLVVVKNSPYFGSGNRKGAKKVDKQSLIALLKGLPTTTCLVFTTREKVDRREKVVQLIKQQGRVWEFPYLQGRDLVKWITVRARQKGVQISLDTARYLAQIWEFGLHRLDCELEKLAAYVGEGGEVSREHIQLLVDPGVKENVFHLLDAVGRRKTRRALLLLGEMLAAGEAPLLLLFLLTQRLRIMGAAQSLARKGLSPRAIAAQLHQHPFVVEKALQQGQHFSFAAIEACLEECLWADRQLKGGLLDPRLVLELLIVKVIGKEGA